MPKSQIGRRRRVCDMPSNLRLIWSAPSGNPAAKILVTAPEFPADGFTGPDEAAAREFGCCPWAVLRPLCQKFRDLGSEMQDSSDLTISRPIRDRNYGTAHLASPLQSRPKIGLPKSSFSVCRYLLFSWQM